MSTAVGIAHADYAYGLVRDVPGLVDFVEVPFEQLLKVPSAIEIRSHVPIVLHCASLSLAGNAPPEDSLVQELERWVRDTQTPWLGEHLAYVRAHGESSQDSMHEAALPCGACFNVGYTVNPQFSEPVLERVARRCREWSERLSVPLLLENGPVYFDMPGSTMSQLEFIARLFTRGAGAGLLLDLSHLAITCANLQIEASEALSALPLDQVVEVHVSGLHVDDGVCWDDHSRRAPAAVFDLLAQLTRKVRPQAVTLEYNWDAAFPIDAVVDDLARVRELLAEPMP